MFPVKHSNQALSAQNLSEYLLFTICTWTSQNLSEYLLYCLHDAVEHHKTCLSNCCNVYMMQLDITKLVWVSAIYNMHLDITKLVCVSAVLSTWCSWTSQNMSAYLLCCLHDVVGHHKTCLSICCIVYMMELNITKLVWVSAVLSTWCSWTSQNLSGYLLYYLHLDGT